MDTEVLYSSEQIKIPENLGDVLKELTKQAIRDQPDEEHLFLWAANFFSKKLNKPIPYPDYKEKSNSVKSLKLAVRPVVICGPSGVGKSTIIHRLMEEYPDKFAFSVSHTTRKPREGEQHGVDYFFVDEQTFTEGIEKGEFIESQRVHGNLYGTSYAAVEKIANEGKCCILDIDVKGAKQVFDYNLNSLFIFIEPPSLEELEKRLRDRGTEKEEDLIIRLEQASKEIEFKEKEGFFKYTIVNDILENAYEQVKAVIADECKIEL